MHHQQLTTDFWSRLRGVRLGGTHELGEWIGDDGTHRYFAISSIQGTASGTIIAVVAGDDKLLENQLSQWNIARRFDHPNLVRVFETGYDEVEGQPVVYAVMEHPDEDLGSVTLGRALTVEETTEVARALIAALKYVHREGFVHGRVDPFSIVAIGDGIKLVTHDAAPAEPALITSDVRALGFTLCQLLSKKIDNALISSKALPAPFDEIVRGCTQRGWGLRQVERVLDGQPAEEYTTVPPESAALPVSSAALPQMETVARGNEEPRESNAPLPDRVKWVAGAAAAGLLAAVLFLTSGRDKTPVSPTEDGTRKPVVTTSVETSAPIASAAAAEVQRPSRAQQAEDWRVIAYTYSSKKDAEERAKRVRTRWPDLQPEVFSPSGAAGPYLVSLGGLMTRPNALRLRAKARANGLPRDTFARNFK